MLSLFFLKCFRAFKIRKVCSFIFQRNVFTLCVESGMIRFLFYDITFFLILTCCLSYMIHWIQGIQVINTVFLAYLTGYSNCYYNSDKVIFNEIIQAKTTSSAFFFFFFLAKLSDFRFKPIPFSFWFGNISGVSVQEKIIYLLLDFSMSTYGIGVL